MRLKIGSDRNKVRNPSEKAVLQLAWVCFPWHQYTLFIQLLQLTFSSYFFWEAYSVSSPLNLIFIMTLSYLLLNCGINTF